MEQQQALIDHLDNTLRGNASAETQQMIDSDPELIREWQFLRLAVDAVQDTALYEEVATVKEQWKIQQTTVIKPAGGIVRTLSRNMAKIAAILVLVGGGAAFFKYATISSGSLYDKYYTSYSLNTSRGASGEDAMDKAYQAKDWNAVIAAFSPAKRTNKSDFLAGMADLELKKYDDAIEHFEQIMAVNAQGNTDYFQDEAQYYLAISWLAKDKVNEALPILEKIRADKNHLYHDKVEKMSFLDLRLVQYKESK
jgi:tetratricopeptide (TPR) repeat protein